MSVSADRPLVLGFPEYAVQARRFASAAEADYREVLVHRFPDGESRIRLPGVLPERVLFCRSLQDPNDKLIELALSARTARELGARHLTLVAPYLCYMRQDTAFRVGEAVSQRIVGDMLAGWFDALVTVDPHLHRVARLRDAVPAQRTRCVSSAPLMARFIDRALRAPVLVGPDSESRQWVTTVAAAQGLDCLIGEKERVGDREVRVSFTQAGLAGRHLVLIDDVASTGYTLESAVAALAPMKPASISVLVTHALFLEGALERLKAAGVVRIWSTDSVPHATNRVELAPLLAAACR